MSRENGCGKLIPLSHARSGSRLKVRRIDGGRRLCARMAALGIYPGAELELVCAGCDCPCLVKVHGSTLSLGAGISRKILVSGPSN
ncbi:FeoA family protein [Desulfacinum hydrothermale]|uniref:FeoA family protein n=1 Tax=Desulfacinum hydrothermale TaxID=109258 RepID=UPI001482EDB0|nr:FeoA family protein [Desulfacinum hydrothermale]